MYARAPCAPLHDSPLTSYATGRGHSSYDCRPERTYGIDNIAAAGGRGCRRQSRGTGRPSLFDVARARSLAVSLLSSSFSRIHLKYTRICREQAVRSSDYWTVYEFVASQSLHNTIFFKKKIRRSKRQRNCCLFFLLHKRAKPAPPPYRLPLPTYPPIPHTPPIRLRAFRLYKTLVLTLNPQNPSVKSISILLCFHNNIKKKLFSYYTCFYVYC